MADPYPSERGAVSMSDQSSTGDVTVERDVTQSSVGELIGEVAADMSTLMRKELELAKAEMKVEAQKASKGVGLLGGAGYAGHLFALLLSLAIAFGLADLLFNNSWGVGLLIVAIVWGIVAAVLYSKGRAQMKKVNPKPEQTVETLKEDVQWAKNRTR